MAQQQLQLDLVEYKSKLDNPKDKFYQKPSQLALAIYAIYQCTKCSNPYIGGKVSCNMAEEDVAFANDGTATANKFICQACSDFEKCNIHGA